MQRRTGEMLVLLLAAILVPGHGAFAAEGKMRSGHADRSAIHPVRTDDHKTAAERRAAAERLEKKMMTVAQADGLRDVAMRFPDRDGPLQNPRQGQAVIEEGAGAGSGFAMLIAGLGVALISIIRRMGNIQ